VFTPDNDGRVRFFIIAKEISSAQSLAAAVTERGPFAAWGSSYTSIADANCELFAGADVVLLDFNIGGAAVRHFVRQITFNRGDARAVVFDIEEESVDDIADLVEAGAAAYVPAPASLVDLIRIGLLAREGLTSCSPRVAFKLFGRLSALSNRHFTSGWVRSADLTTREFDILQLLAHNSNNKEIADRLCLSVPTVKNHVHHLLSKLGVRSRVEAVGCWKDAQRRGRLDPSCIERPIVRARAAQ